MRKLRNADPEGSTRLLPGTASIGPGIHGWVVAAEHSSQSSRNLLSGEGVTGVSEGCCSASFFSRESDGRWCRNSGIASGPTRRLSTPCGTSAASNSPSRHPCRHRRLRRDPPPPRRAQSAPGRPLHHLEPRNPARPSSGPPVCLSFKAQTSNANVRRDDAFRSQAARGRRRSAYIQPPCAGPTARSSLVVDGP